MRTVDASRPSVKKPVAKPGDPTLSSPGSSQNSFDSYHGSSRLTLYHATNLGMSQPTPMLPPTHLSLGYLFYSAYLRISARRPDALGVVLITIGAVLPDIIDKPLQLIGFFSAGRTIGHSLILGIPAITLLGFLLYQRTEDVKYPFALMISYVVHPLADAINYPLQGTLATDFEEMAFLVWPIDVSGEAIVEALSINKAIFRVISQKPAWTATHLPAGEELSHLLRVFELCVTVIAIVVWNSDGKPGLQEAHSHASRII